MPDHPFAARLYRALLKLYPATFREEYEGPMEREFRDELSESNSVLALAALWLRILPDFTLSVAVQLARELAQDARHTFRLWRKNPWQTAFAIVALALGIGVNVGVFSVINALLLRSLPFHDPGRLAAMVVFIPPHDTADQFHNWRQHSTYLADTALFEDADFNIGNPQQMLRAHVAQVSSNFFSLLGVQPSLGRAFSAGEDTNGKNNVAVIGHGLWEQLYAGNPHVIGSTIRLNGVPLTIIGVAPAWFDFPNQAVLWKAAQFNTGNNGWNTIARLKPGLSWGTARAAFKTEVDRLWPNRRNIDKITFPSRLVPLQQQLAGPVRRASFVLMAFVALVLLIACANVANLLLARTAGRAPELSIRSALGASKARLVQQLMTECLLLSLTAAAAGLAVAFWTTSIAAKGQPAPLATQSYSIVDVRVLAFSIAIALAGTVIFGLLPALYAGRVHSFTARGASGNRSPGLIRETLVAAQVILTIVLLTASVSVGRSFLHLMRMDRGFVPRQLVTVSVSLDGTARGVNGKQLPYVEEVLAALRRVPGVRSASVADFLPLYATGFIGGPFGLDGQTPKTNANFLPVLAGYFQTMGTKLLYGRDFTDREVRSDVKVAVVNEQFAKQFLDPRDVVGHLVTLSGEPPRRIIGVVKGTDFMSEWVTGIGDQFPPEVFVPAHVPGAVFSTSFVVRVRGNARQNVAMIRNAIRSVDPRVPVFSAKTMEQRMEEAFARPQFYRTGLVFLSCFSLLLAGIGIYSTVSYAVAQRTREMGVRLALGTTPPKLRSALLLQNSAVVAIAGCVGCVGALFNGRFLQSLFEGATAADLCTLAASTGFVFLVAALSVWTGSRHIAHLNIAEILKAE